MSRSFGAKNLDDTMAFLDGRGGTSRADPLEDKDETGGLHLENIRRIYRIRRLPGEHVVLVPHRERVVRWRTADEFPAALRRARVQHLQRASGIADDDEPVRLPTFERRVVLRRPLHAEWMERIARGLARGAARIRVRRSRRFRDRARAARAAGEQRKRAQPSACGVGESAELMIPSERSEPLCAVAIVAHDSIRLEATVHSLSLTHSHGGRSSIFTKFAQSICP